jgi:LmbE family N-acetylglucosaminyl deacetylase
MLITDLGQVRNDYQHIYLSPHLDDAALSCGGAIARHAATDDRVLVVTICTAAPPPDGPFSTFAQELHRLWSLAPEEVVTARLREDDRALELLNADTYRPGLLDAIYRMPDVYDSNAALFGTPAPADPLLPAACELIAKLRDRFPRAAFYAPLGVGNHVDHQIAHSAAQEVAGAAVAFYEDFPYVTRPRALEQRMAALGRTFVASTIDIDATLARKVKAIAAYTSQFGTLFENPATFEQFVAEYAESLRPEAGTYGERLWINAER